ncbi:MAG: ABC transporter ATP-binding protein [Clostridium sp.]
MFTIIKRIINWSGDKKRRIYIGFLFSFIQSIFIAMPIMGATYGLNLILEDFEGVKKLNPKFIWYMLIFMIICVLGRAFFSYLKSVYQESVGHECAKDERIEIGDVLKRVSLGFFDTYSTGDLTSAVTTDLNFLENYSTKMIDVVINGYITAITMILFLAFTNLKVALIALCGILVSYIFLKCLGNRSSKNAITHQIAQENMVGATIEYVRGLAIVKAFSSEGSGVKNLESAYNESKDINIKIEKSYAPFNCLHLVSLDVAGTMMVLVSAYLTLENEISLPIFLMITIFSFIIFNNIKAISDGIHVLQTIDKTMDKLDKIKNGQFIDEFGKDLKISKYDIKFENVSFAYGDKTVIKDMSFDIPENSITAIIGPSGGGKSTICNLIARFYDVQKGKITIGKKDIKEFSCDSLLKNISMVFQKVYLFNDTIKNNIKFGNPNATDDEIKEAAKKARCHEFIISLPNGYDTVIGDAGSSLSGGEKQRISIARAILKDAPIVILDEATASVDPENEHYIQQAISELTKGKTIIIIAHRLATIENANQILVVKDGKLEQKGNHKKLIEQDGTYKKFIEIRKQTEGWVV